MIIFKNNCIIELDTNYCKILHDGAHPEFIEAITVLFNEFKERQRRQPREINLIVKSMMRKGRLIAKHEFGKPGQAKAQLLTAKQPAIPGCFFSHLSEKCLIFAISSAISIMAKPQSLESFYREKLNWLPANLQREIGHFNVFRLEDCIGDNKQNVQYTRRDFYKISLVRGKWVYHYADKSIETSGPTLLFFNPSVPYTFEQLGPDSTGYFCIFKEGFFSQHLRNGMKNFPMFLPGNNPCYALNKTQDRQISQIFLKMLEEIGSEYTFKYDLLRNYVMEMMHYAMKIQPSETLYQHTDANARITSVFTELLERQFPIETTTQRFTMKSAKDFAEQLNVHVNHLNRAIRTTTGKTTSEHIAGRLATEAKSLLMQTDWNISEVGYCLGFESSAHFNHFFRKQTSLTPSSFRKSPCPVS